jgi:glutamate-1-semialdehyde 2,1-aminomutase
VHDLVRVFEFNDLESLTEVCRTAGSDLAAVIIEPLLGSGGAVPATPEFLARARQLADETGAVLILDEVQTFRLSTGGLQQRLGCRPDLTTLGKLIGGGFPIGAVAGPRDLLDIFRQDSPHHLEHSGTYNGNLVSMAAGLKAVEMLTEDAIDTINETGQALADTLARAVDDCGLPGCVTGYGSMFNAHLGANARVVKTASDVLGEDARLMELLHLAFLNEGVFTSPRGFLNCSTALTDRDVQQVAKALARAVEAVAAEADAI